MVLLAVAAEGVRWLCPWKGVKPGEAAGDVMRLDFCVDSTPKRASSNSNSAMDSLTVFNLSNVAWRRARRLEVLIFFVGVEEPRSCSNMTE